MLFIAETSNSDFVWSFVGLVLGWPLGFFLGYAVGKRSKK